jgi:acyl transferase domain-containing protein
MTKKTAVVICPGRGTYNKPELGYFARHHAEKTGLLAMLDRFRAGLGQPTISELDGAERYSAAIHTRGDNASPLIYACAYADFLSIDRDAVEVVAVTGNSMGWYIALACSQALSDTNAMAVVNTMGTLMQENLIGGQLVYPVVDADWRDVPGRRGQLLSLVEQISTRPGHSLFVSIDLGGMLVFAGNETGLAALEAELEPVQDRFPMRLKNHAAFHTPLLETVAEMGRAMLSPELFRQPEIPLIDGRGGIWYPQASDCGALWDYTLGHQVTRCYDFTRAVQVATVEFAPDYLIVPGPGNTLGGAVAQSLIGIGWQGLADKDGFLARQAEAPIIVSMGMDEQRMLVTG